MDIPNYTETIPSYFQYWGKARAEHCEGARYHLLPYHCLDVAAVAFEYLDRNDHLSAFFSKKLNCTIEDWLSWATFWIALHDLGKFSVAFQSQRPELVALLQGHEPNSEKHYTERHDTLGFWLWKQWICDSAIDECWFGTESESLMPGINMWAGVVTGHHGQPPKSTAYLTLNDFFTKKDKKAASLFVEDIRSLLLSPSAAAIGDSLGPVELEHISFALSWLFSGVAVLADWLGSNKNYFQYQTNEISLSEYWQQARLNAVRALNSSGVLYRPVKPDLTFKRLFPVIKDPSPLQQWAINERVTEQPSIYLLEDVTGAGKTEAALTLAYRLMDAGAAEGFFIALPTMATANAMYARITEFYGQLFEGDTDLVLAHGSKCLVEKFAASVVPDQISELDSEQIDETASARCSAWLADHNKRALLAQAGVGTIDQVLLGVLHSKHQSLRLLGLFRKVLIIDEVHACDSYMQGVLEVLLEFHARAGGSAILLSATMPKRMKQALLQSFAKGREFRPPTITKDDFPLVTGWQSSEPDLLIEAPAETRQAVRRTVAVKNIDSLQAVVARINVALKAGQCVCWVRNTVADVMDAYELFRELPEEIVTVFHARFALGDRLDKEYQILDNFGVESTSASRSGKLVIASQVIEMSLNVDFDVLISDLAPIDRLIQRAGRLCRHVRDESGNRLLAFDAEDQRGEPCMLVYGPSWTNAPTSDWFKEFFPKASGVYPDHSQIWRTAKALQDGCIRMPDDARALVEDVFGDDVDVPSELSKSSLKVQGEKFADASHAKANALKFVQGYQRGDVVDWWSEAKTPSRLGEASISVVLARWEGDRLVPWIQREHAWSYSTVKVAERLLAEAQEPTKKAQLAEFLRVKEELPGKGKWSVLLPLTFEGDSWKAEAWSGETNYRKAKLITWEYDAVNGLKAAPKQPENEGME